jgi:hypothetical protein
MSCVYCTVGGSRRQSLNMSSGMRLVDSAPESTSPGPTGVSAWNTRATFHSPRAWGRDDRRLARIEAAAWRIEEADRFDLRPSSTGLRTLLTGLLDTPAQKVISGEPETFSATKFTKKNPKKTALPTSTTMA